MRKNILMLALSVLVVAGTVAPAAAQGQERSRQEVRTKKHKDDRKRKSPEERAKLRAERMTKELDLNKSQARKVEALYLKEAKQRESQRADFRKGDRKSAESREAMRAEMIAAHKHHNEELKDILNKKQYAKYEEMQAQKREQMKARHHEKGGKGKRGQHERGRMQQS